MYINNICIVNRGVPGILEDMCAGRIMPVFIMYFIAGYIKRFKSEKRNNVLEHYYVSFLFFVILFASFYIITFVGVKLNNPQILSSMYFYRSLNSPLVVIICVELFLGILETDVEYSKIVNCIASATFGVYLIHCNTFIDSLLRRIFQIYKVKNSFFLFLYSFLGVASIYIGCTILDLIRQHTFGKLWNKMVEKNILTIQNGITVFINKKISKVKILHNT